jgi:chromosomal replication initiation ATPase DnaA
MNRYQDLDDILELVSRATEVSIQQIKSDSRLRDVVQARHLYCWLARNKTGRSMKQIGRVVRISRTPVIHSVKKIDGFIKVRDADTLFFLHKIGA